MSTTTLHVRPELGPWRKHWDDLVLRQPLPSPFQRSWWLEALIPSGVVHALVTDGDRLLGGLALGSATRAGVTRLTAPGPPVLCPDHLDVLAEPGHEPAVVQALGRWFRSPGQRQVDVRGAVAGGLLAQVVGGTHHQHDEAPYDELEPGADWLAARSSGFRRSVRRGRKRLDEAGYEHRRLPADEVGRGLEELRLLHERREDRGPLLDALPVLARAVTAGAARGEARVDVLASAHDTAAVVVSFVVGGRLSLYQVARSTAPEHGSAGTALLAAVVEDAAAAGCREVDMLRGSEDYKTSFVDRTRALERVRGAHGGWAATLLRAEDGARRVSARLRSRGGSGA
ncbi:MAG TPA: GNAT family N-acetyltransferase [Nocardioides sp.]|nr:GNAT family N-acetyltransferase [Nocardioides sp.]